MYIPSHFREERLDVLHDLIRSQSLATIVTYGASGLIASHIPVVLDPAPTTLGPLGTLRGHISRANPQWQDYAADVDALAIFAGPQHYVTPSWYASKQEHGKVVPTWNYVVVHAYGRLTLFDDRDALLANVRALTQTHEATRDLPWRVDDAPASYIDGQLKGIIGLELAITRLEGKWKVSQNRPAPDRAGIVRGLRAEGDAPSLTMADLVDAAKIERR
jgi:transcriptional regulator